MLGSSNVGSRITAMVLAPPPPPNLPSTSSYAFAEASSASVKGTGNMGDEDDWAAVHGGGAGVSNGSGGGAGVVPRNAPRNGASFSSSPSPPPSPPSPSSLAHSTLFTTTTGLIFDPAYFDFGDEQGTHPDNASQGVSDSDGVGGGNANANNRAFGPGDAAVGGPGSVGAGGAGGSSTSRRCRVWVVCRQDTLRALDVEIWDYGDAGSKRSAACSADGREEDARNRGARGGSGDLAQGERRSGLAQRFCPPLGLGWKDSH